MKHTKVTRQLPCNCEAWPFCEHAPNAVKPSLESPCANCGNTPHSEPTYENQLWHARKLADEQGLKALYSPHAATGKICGCGDCFCCAALQVYKERTK